MREPGPMGAGEGAPGSVGNRAVCSCSSPRRRNGHSGAGVADDVLVDRYPETVRHRCANPIGQVGAFEIGSIQSIMRIILITINAVVNPRFGHEARVRPSTGAAARFGSPRPMSRPSRLRVPGTDVLPYRPGFAISVTAISETPRVRPGPVSTSTGTRPSRLPPRRRARGWPPRGCEHVRRAGIGYVR